MKIKVYILKDKYSFAGSFVHFTEPKILISYNEYFYSGNNLQNAIYNGYDSTTINFDDIHSIGMYDLYEIEPISDIHNNIDIYNNIMNNIPEELL